VIDDAIEVPRDFRSFSSIQLRPRAVWVGSKDNWVTIARLKDLIRHSDLEGKIEIVTISDHPEATLPWSEQSVLSECRNSDFALLPTDCTPRAKAKSSNRLAMFLAMGLPVLAESIPSYQDLARQAGGVAFVDGNSEWIDKLGKMCDPKYRIHLIGDAATRVRTLLDMSIIGERWIDVLNSVIAPKH
jgi:hypothetical protein